MMKIASRWAEAEVVKSSTKKTEKEGEKDSAVKSFESEQSSLFKEMAKVEKEKRVWRFTEAVDEGIVTKAPIFSTASNIVYDDTKVLKNVGARSESIETYNNFVLESEGLAEDKTGEVLANTTIANNEENSIKDENVVYIPLAQLGLSRVEENP